MHIFLVVFLASDCSGHVFGAYATQKQACAAVSRCQLLERPWQYHAWSEAQAAEPVALRTKPVAAGQITLPGASANLCVVQKVLIGQDDEVNEMVCPDAAPTPQEDGGVS